jgi:hypothetical protein
MAIANEPPGCGSSIHSWQRSAAALHFLGNDPPT